MFGIPLSLIFVMFLFYSAFNFLLVMLTAQHYDFTEQVTLKSVRRKHLLYGWIWPITIMVLFFDMIFVQVKLFSKIGSAIKWYFKKLILDK